MEIKPIRTKADYRKALKEIETQSGLAPKDLVPMIGQLNRVYEILNRRRPLTLKMVWRLHRELGIPAESLIKQDQRRKAA
jgi:HTH-type transcriptional regulator/antitoxin HigA